MPSSYRKRAEISFRPKRKGVSVSRNALLLLTAANTLTRTRTWTTVVFPTTIDRMGTRGNAIGRSGVRIHMQSGNEGGGSSYEEQYAAFSKLQQQQQQQHQRHGEPPRDLPSATTSPIEEARTKNSMSKYPIDAYPLRREDARRSFPDPVADSKAEEDLEMAFLDFISGPPYQAKAVPPVGTTPNKDFDELYADISTSLEFGSFPTTYWNPKDDVTKGYESIPTSNNAIESVTSHASHLFESSSNARESIPTADAVKDATESGVSVSVSSSKESESTSSSSQIVDDAVGVDTSSDNLSFFSSTSYLEMLGANITSRDKGINISSENDLPLGVTNFEKITNARPEAANPVAVYLKMIGGDSKSHDKGSNRSSSSDQPSVANSSETIINTRLEPTNSVATVPSNTSDPIATTTPDTTATEKTDIGSESDAPDSKPTSKPKPYTVEVCVETTFPTGITVEDAKRGWLEFCWARGGGIVVPMAVSDKPPPVSEKTPSASKKPSLIPEKPLSASETNATNADSAPFTIKFESREGKSKVRHDEKSTNTGHGDDNDNAGELNIPTGIPTARELIVPLGLKQELVSSISTLDEIQADTIRRDVIKYKTTHRGFFCRDMIQDTHEGRVEFIGASYTSTRMIWTVKFQVEQDEGSPSESAASANVIPTSMTSQGITRNFREFASNTKTMVEGYSSKFLDSNPGLKTMGSKANIWGSWSQFQLKTASQNLVAYLDTSAVLEHTETLPVGVSPQEAMETWYDYYWKNGGGTLPVVLSHDEDREKRWVIPSGLEEELISLEYDHPVSESGVVGVDGEITTETEIAKAVYKINNPSLLTYPVYYHRATVRFVRDGNSAPTQLFWEVKVKPYRKFLGGSLLFWTKNEIALASRNLRNLIELRQLERQEKQLQAQLDRIRMQKNNSSTSLGDTETYDEEDRMPSGKFKTIRSTFSISSGQEVDETRHDKESAKIGANDGPEKNGVAEKVNQQVLGQGQGRYKKRPTYSVPPGVSDDREGSPNNTVDKKDERTRAVYIPRRTIESVTMPIDSHTRAVNDGGEEDVWQSNPSF